jgi:murein L,D-transpeptidase YcbB/YkuD
VAPAPTHGAKKPAPAKPVAAPATPAKSAKPVLKSTLKVGAKNGLVKYLQNALKVPVTGVYDQATVDAVKKLQTAKGLKADGLAGPLTWEHIN